MMLNVKPKERPDSSTLLNSKIITSKINEFLKVDQFINHEIQSKTHNELLKTIKFPKNFETAKVTLPKSRYESEINHKTEETPPKERQKMKQKGTRNQVNHRSK